MQANNISCSFSLVPSFVAVIALFAATTRLHFSQKGMFQCNVVEIPELAYMGVSPIRICLCFNI